MRYCPHCGDSHECTTSAAGVEHEARVRIAEIEAKRDVRVAELAAQQAKTYAEADVEIAESELLALGDLHVGFSVGLGLLSGQLVRQTSRLASISASHFGPPCSTPGPQPFVYQWLSPQSGQ